MTDKETMPGLIWAIYDLGDQYRGVWYHEDKWSVDDCEAYIRADLYDAAIAANDAEIAQLRAVPARLQTPQVGFGIMMTRLRRFGLHKMH